MFICITTIIFIISKIFILYNDIIEFFFIRLKNFFLRFFYLKILKLFEIFCKVFFIYLRYFF
jgi:hypothetical protein